MWSAARRLAMIVACEVALVTLTMLRARPIGALAAVSGGLGLALFLASLPSLVRASHIVRDSQRAKEPAATSKVYRTSAKPIDPDAAERAVVRHAAAALMLLAAAGAITVVAAASR